MQEGELRSADRIGWVEQQSKTGKSKKNFRTSYQSRPCKFDGKTACAYGIGEFDASVVISRQDAYVARVIDLFAPLLRSMTGCFSASARISLI